MITDTRSRIVEYVKHSGQTRVQDIHNSFQISNVAIHKHLKKLLQEGIIVRVGKPPSVVYSLSSKTLTKRIIGGEQLPNLILNDAQEVSPNIKNLDRKTKGRLAEAKVIAYLVEKGYEVYLPFSNNSKYDVLALKDGRIKRISTKYTSAKQNTATWKVEMRQIYRGNSTIKIDKFDSTQFDLIAVYIGPKDKVILVDASKATRLALYTRG